MDAIPMEFLSIVDRLKQLLELKIIIIEENKFDYEDAAWKFKVVAQNPSWQASSEMVIVKIKELIGKLYQKNYLIYNDITNHIEKDDSKEILAIIKSKDGGKSIITPKTKVSVKVKTENKHREFWFKNIIPELKAYESLSKDNFSKHELIPEETAIKLSQLKIKGVGDLLSQQGNSRSNFVRLLCDPCLLDYEISQMKIIFDVPKKNIVAELNSLISQNILPYTSVLSLIDFNCFYYMNNGVETLITKKSFSEGVSKNKLRSAR